ncbi:uncharacterized protein LOC130630624 isoform X1 [Hydractinia symbiolongicarpus]|uniref:uncharacterized protein LOC130630624 isoform X1 n=1 Tax=Hydractinia symbiolongicarpus TaxID=13093 RepID=UPI0025512CD6|nr:uncharacterized protein LOC130630624 isoform X1 [Hydractinia symbiolongicarpus]
MSSIAAKATVFSFIFILFYKETESNLISLSECGYTKYCQKHPSNCKSNKDCDLIVTWQQNKTNPSDAVLFEMSTKKASGHRWIANALNIQAGRMANSAGEVCMFDGMSGGLRGFEATARGIPPVYYDGVKDVVLHEVELTDDTLVCRYSRRIISTSEYMKDLNQSFYLVNAFGQQLQNNFEVVQHNYGDYRFTNTQVEISPYVTSTPPLCLSQNDLQYCVLEVATEVHRCMYVEPVWYPTTFVLLSLTIVASEANKVQKRESSEIVFSTVLSSNVYKCTYSTSRPLPPIKMTSSPASTSISPTTTLAAQKTSITQSLYVSSSSTMTKSIHPTQHLTETQVTRVLRSSSSYNLPSSSSEIEPSTTMFTTVLPLSSISKDSDCFWDTCKTTRQIAQKSYAVKLEHSYPLLVCVLALIVVWI